MVVTMDKNRIILIGAGVLVFVVMVALAILSLRNNSRVASTQAPDMTVEFQQYQVETLGIPSSTATQTTAQDMQIPTIKTCKTLVRGDWPLKVIRQLGTPGVIDPGPYKYTRDGKTYEFQHWTEFSQFKYFYAGEEICLGGK